MAASFQPDLLWNLFVQRTDQVNMSRATYDRAKLEVLQNQVEGASGKDLMALLSDFIEADGQIKLKRNAEDRQEVRSVLESALSYFPAIYGIRPKLSENIGVGFSAIQVPAYLVTDSLGVQKMMATTASEVPHANMTARKIGNRAPRSYSTRRAVEAGWALDPLKAMSIHQVPPDATICKKGDQFYILPCIICGRFMPKPASMYYHLNQNNQAHRDVLGEDTSHKRAALTCGREVVDATDEVMEAHNMRIKSALLQTFTKKRSDDVRTQSAGQLFID